MRVLVTGGTGFLGAYVVNGLIEEGHEVRTLVRPGRPRGPIESRGVEMAEGDLTDEISLRVALTGMEGLVHCAARSGFWSGQNLEQRRVNVEGTSALYRAAHAAKVKRIVHVSSIAAVGVTRDGTVLDETAQWTGIHPSMNYVITKRESEERALAAARAKMPIVVVNPGALMGPRLDGSPPAWHLKRIALGKTKWAPKGGSSMVDVQDVAQGIITALDRGRVGERYILGGHNLTWRELYERTACHVGARPSFREVPLFMNRVLVFGSTLLDMARLSRPPWTPEFFRLWGWYAWVDSGKAKKKLGYVFRSLDEVLGRYDWS
jgi:dihydroflavonol-4-reductase